jgi:hypothetical protein
MFVISVMVLRLMFISSSIVLCDLNCLGIFLNRMGIFHLPIIIT